MDGREGPSRLGPVWYTLGMQHDPQLRYLFQLIPDGPIFRRWCARTGIGSLQEFVEVDLSSAPEPWHGPWSQVQDALREADAISRRDSPVKGWTALDRMLRRPPARVRVDAGVLRNLTPIIPPAAVPTRAPMSAREALVDLGGVAGARAIAARLSEHLGRSVTVRQVRDRFRNTGGKVRKLGAGYFSTGPTEHPPVLHWVEARLAQGGAEPVDDLLEALLEAYPNGDERAVRAWLHQQPGVLSVRRGTVRVVPPVIGAGSRP